MMSAMLALALIAGGFDAGGNFAGTFPLGGFDRYQSSTALVGAHVGYDLGRVRVEVSYGYATLPGLQASPYRLALHLARLSGGYQFLARPDWGIEAVAGAGYGRAERSFAEGWEAGGVGLGSAGLNLIQRAGHTRLSVGLHDDLLLEGGGDPGRVAVSQLLSVRAGVSYVF